METALNNSRVSNNEKFCQVELLNKNIEMMKEPIVIAKTLADYFINELEQLEVITR